MSAHSVLELKVYMFTRLFFKTTPEGRHCCSAHLTDEKTESESSQNSLASSGLVSVQTHTPLDPM